MDTIVVDSSVAIKWFIAEVHSDKARQILDVYETEELTLLAPDIINAEIGNIVWRKHTKQGLSAALAQDAIREFQKIVFTFIPTADLLSQAYQLAVTHNCTVYDALYLALSIRESCRLATADEELVRAVGGTFPNVVLLANWH